MATFTDADPGGVLSDYAASINWGDGNSSTGTIAAGNGNFVVNGAHSFEEGAHTITVTISDAGGSSAAAYGTANVADAALTSQGWTGSASATEGEAGSNVLLATFSDADPNGATADYTALVHWGDGTSSIDRQGLRHNLLCM